MTIIDFLPVFAAGVASVLLAWVWYAPVVFGGPWMRLIGMTPEMVERGKKRMHLYSLIALIASMLTAWVMSFIATLFGVYDWFGAAELGFWCWVGFTAAPMLGTVLWEQKPLRYYVIVSGYWLVAFVTMALIIVLTPRIFVSTLAPSDASASYGTTSF